MLGPTFSILFAFSMIGGNVPFCFADVQQHRDNVAANSTFDFRHANITALIKNTVYVTSNLRIMCNTNSLWLRDSVGRRSREPVQMTGSGSHGGVTSDDQLNHNDGQNLTWAEMLRRNDIRISSPMVGGVGGVGGWARGSFRLISGDCILSPQMIQAVVRRQTSDMGASTNDTVYLTGKRGLALVYIKPDSFERSPVRAVHIEDQHKFYLPEYRPFIASQHITHLHMNRTSLVNLYTHSLSGLPHLRDLVVSHSKLTRLADDRLFQLNPHLTTIDFSNNLIEFIAPMLFQNQMYLKTLDLSHNRFTHVPSNAPIFLINVGLEKLNLDMCRFTSLPFQFFHGLPALTTLSMRFNSLERICFENFRYNDRLKHLYIYPLANLTAP